MLFLLAAAVLLANVQAKIYKDCGSKLATVQSVTLSNYTEDAEEWIVKRNSNASVTIEFTPSVDAKTVETVIHGIIMKLPCPFPLPQPDACKDSGLVCPIKANKKVSYRLSLPVLKAYPKVKADVKLELQNGDDQNLVCVIIPIRLH